ncbi:type II toxin-antitoxin system HicA family toxin [Erwinia pyri]|uniref:Type II toxin-antitoxin system HicA family toxin n=2 Tax=Erwinia pyri TaxID=3062598 RepID=A0AA50DLB2_9GAMM|nr:type II toxin-antitoxin system HicA family toxin [Erwinia sp. DE2]WLS79112.1 type II toxin-antitoxin system HicA family toxin [Erwinia sp. DE2]
MSSRELMKLLQQNGWVLNRVKGSHHIFIKEGKEHHITVPHPEKNVAKGTLHDILKNM